MPIISPTAISPHRIGGKSWSSYWKTHWYLTTGVTASDIVAAYQFVDQPDEATSLHNLIDAGTHHLTKSGSPVWNTATGWTGDGTGHLRSDIIATSDYTIIIKFKNGQGGTPRIMGSNRTGALIQVSPGYSQYNNPSVAFGGQKQTGNYTGITNGIFALVDQKCYINGTDTGVVIGAWTFSPPDTPIYILTSCQVTSGASYMPSRASVENVVIYNKKLSPEQVAAINTNLEEHFPSSGKNLSYSNISNKLLTAATTEWYGRPSMEIVNGVVVLVYPELAAHASTEGEYHIRFSDDRGDTWTDEDVDLDGNAVTGFPMSFDTTHASNSFIMVAPNGDLILHMIAYALYNGTWQSVSTDDGLTWSVPEKLAIGGTTADDLINFCEDYFVYDGVMYCSGVQWDANPRTKGAAILLKSEDNGATWSYVSTIAANNTCDSAKGASEVGLEYLGNNRIIAVLRDYGEYGSAQTFSTDMGATWATPYNAGITISGRHRIWTKKHLMEEANWWTDTNLIMLGFIHGRRHVLWASSDGGLTWSNKFEVDTVAVSDAGYGDLMMYDANNIVLMGYSGTTDAANIKQYKVSI